MYCTITAGHSSEKKTVVFYRINDTCRQSRHCASLKMVSFIVQCLVQTPEVENDCLHLVIMWELYLVTAQLHNGTQ